MKSSFSPGILRSVLAITLSGLISSPGMIAREQVLWFDFGGADARTAPPPVYWNNVNAELGATPFGFIDLVDMDGRELTTQLFIDTVFDLTPNTGGTGSSTSFPASASGDSLVSSNGLAVLALVNNPGNADTYSFTFYASDDSAGDNRETRYEIAGATSGIADLNPSGNVDAVGSFDSVAPNDIGEISLTLSPGPNHSDANNVVYLGVLRIDSSQGWSALIDFGGADNQTTVVGGGPVLNWNNVTGGVADTDNGALLDIVSTDGAASDLTLQMVSRFNGVNTGGTSVSSLYPASATQDSWYANTEDFGVGPDITPIFMITGLKTGTAYDFTFYASRMGAGGDNRETLYTLTGATTEATALNPSENIDGAATVTGIQPDPQGGVTIALSPGPNNDNGFHFIYLGVLLIQSPSEGLTYLFDFGGESTTQVEVEEGDQSWNNIVETVGLTDNGTVDRLVTAEGVRTDITFQMVSRFNGVNRNGTLESALFPVSATRDSLFGNTESFNGLENVFPAFKLTGLDPQSTYQFQLYGSRTASDNRETRYSVTGASSGIGDLNAAGNVDETVTVNCMVPNAAGEVAIAIEPGPNNNNGSHFTYLGFMRVEWEKSFVPRILIDAGGNNFPTASADDVQVWNNFPASVAQADNGVMSDLLAVNGASTEVGIQMIARFNGVNEAGTQEPAPYPVSATRDSLFGNTEEWSGLTDVFPRFILTGLNTATAYDLTFYASRNATDNRETQYTVQGVNESVVLLNVAGNIDQRVTAAAITPTPEGTITVSLAPGPNNDNANHFTYLGVLQLDWAGGPVVSEAPSLSHAELSSDVFSFRINGRSCATYRIQSTTDFRVWTDEQTLTLPGETMTVAIPVDITRRFYRVAP